MSEPRVSTVDGVTAEQLMSTPVIAVTPGHDVASVWEVMRTRHIHHVPIVEDGRVVAVLDDRTVAAHWPIGGPEAAHQVEAGQIATFGAQCVLPDAPVRVIAQVMRRAQADVVPVVEPGGRLLGLVTATDLVAALAGD
jgi:CBS domain-containing protein